MPTVLKKTTSSPEENNNFRPICLIFALFRKSLKKGFATQIIKYLCEVFQSAYREFHSTVIALICVHLILLLLLIIRNQSVILLLLDISAALDTVDDDILLLPLCKRFAVSRFCVKMVPFENDNHIFLIVQSSIFIKVHGASSDHQ